MKREVVEQISVTREVVEQISVTREVVVAAAGRAEEVKIGWDSGHGCLQWCESTHCGRSAPASCSTKVGGAWSSFVHHLRPSLQLRLFFVIMRMVRAFIQFRLANMSIISTTGHCPLRHAEVVRYVPDRALAITPCSYCPTCRWNHDLHVYLEIED